MADQSNSNVNQTASQNMTNVSRKQIKENYEDLLEWCNSTGTSAIHAIKIMRRLGLDTYTLGDRLYVDTNDLKKLIEQDIILTQQRQLKKREAQRKARNEERILLGIVAILREREEDKYHALRAEYLGSSNAPRATPSKPQEAGGTKS
jgi:hypothetical protein